MIGMDQFSFIWLPFDAGCSVVGPSVGWTVVLLVVGTVVDGVVVVLVVDV